MTPFTLCAGCVWRRTKAGWRADRIACPPALRWMLGMTPKQVAYELTRRGWNYEWVVLAEAKKKPGREPGKVRDEDRKFKRKTQQESKNYYF